MSKPMYLAGAVAGLLIAILAISAFNQTDAKTHTSPVAAAATTTTPVDEPMPTAPTTTTTTPVDGRTPAEIQVDQAANAAGITTVPYPNTYPHETVAGACDTMRQPAPTLPAGTWLARNVTGSPDLVQLYRIGFPALCPEYVPALDAVLMGEVPFGGGTWEIGAAQGKVAPGRWRITTAVSDCYWERTSRGGEILDNQFATHAVTGGITVTIRPTDGSFTTDRCGIWERVR